MTNKNYLGRLALTGTLLLPGCFYNEPTNNQNLEPQTTIQTVPTINISKLITNQKRVYTLNFNPTTGEATIDWETIELPNSKLKNIEDHIK
jgi:hypothetical protein